VQHVGHPCSKSIIVVLLAVRSLSTSRVYAPRIAMSNPRPIHQPHREIRHVPDETEPSYSYEQETFLPKSEDEVEDEFHRRLQFKGSFWRTSDASSASVGPSFSSMNMDQQSGSDSPETKTEEESPLPRSPPSPKKKEKDLPKSVRDVKQGGVQRVVHSCGTGLHGGFCFSSLSCYLSL
jgi:hypothetical protein